MTAPPPASTRGARTRPPAVSQVGVPIGVLAGIVVGFAAAVVFVLLEGHTHVVPGTTPPSRWFGTLDVVSPRRRAVDSVAAFVAIAVLAGCWLALARSALAGRVRLRMAAGAAVLWALPFAVGPALTSLDMYIYVAHGWLARAGQSPYLHPPGALGPGPVLAAVDPRWHSVLDPYGPVAVLFERTAAQVGGSPLGTVVALRLLASAAAAAAVVLATALTRPPARTRTLVLFGSNPLLLTTTFSAAHFEALMLALLLAGLVADRRGRPVLGLVLVVAAGLVKVPAFAAVPFLLLEHWRTGERRQATAARDLATVAASLGIGGLLVPHGWAWTSTVLHTPSTGRLWWTPSTLLAEIGAGLARLVGVDATTTSLLGATRSLCLLAAVALFGYLLRVRGDVVLRLGIGLTALAVLGFVLFPWYLLWGWPLLIVAGGRRLAFRAAALGTGLTVMNLWPQHGELVPLRDAAREHPTAAIAVLLVAVLVAVLLVAVVLAVAGVGWLTRRRVRSEQPAGGDLVATDVGSVEQDPAVGVDQLGPLVTDGGVQHERGAPPHP